MKTMAGVRIFVTFLLTFVCYKVKSSPCTMETRCKCTRLEEFLIVDCQDSGLNITEVCLLCGKVKEMAVLDLSKNNLRHISDNCFASCHGLLELRLESNALTWLSKDAFIGLSNLTSLTLNKNALVKDGNFSGPDAFKPLHSIRELYLQNNAQVTNDSKILHYLSNINNDVFPNLQILYLDGLPNASFASNFMNFKRLEYIDFSGDSNNCNIIALTNKSFDNIPYAISLNLANCNISYIEAGTFSPLRELKYLNLSSNMALGFVTLRNVSFGLQFTNIKILDYSKVYKTFGLSTEIRRCDVWYLRNTSLREIHVNSNRIGLVEANALYLLPPTLQVVWAEDNQLSYGPFSLQMGCLQNLSKLELSKQNIVHALELYNKELYIHEKELLPQGKCEVPENASKPTCPFLENKPLDVFSVSFPETLEFLGWRRGNLRYERAPLTKPLPIRNKIKSIDISSNIMYNWSGPFILLRHLKYVDASNNFCTDMSADVFDNAPYLEGLNASNNKVGPRLALDITGSLFKSLQNMRLLNFSNNWIDFLPENVFIYLTTLETLDLSFNRIQNVTFILSSMTKLTEVYLKENKISSIPMKVLKHLESNAQRTGKNITIDLSGNEITVSCSNIDFLTWMMEHDHYFKNIHTYKFRKDGGSSVSYQNMVSSLDRLQKGCKTYTLLICLSVAIITSFVGIIIGGLCYRFRWRLRYFYYMTKAKYLGYLPLRNNELQKIYPYDAFISYAHEDYLFVKDEMIPKLEEEAGFSLCVHQRDFIPGHYIAENILQAIKDSKLTIVLLSPNFLQSKWCIYEFNMARMESIYSRDGENTVFVVMYDDIDMTYISHEMRQCLESESFLKFPDDESEMQYFWHMLKDALGGTKL